MEPLRVGVIGCGRHARANIYPALSLAGGQVVSVASRHLDRAAATAAAFGARPYGDYRAMLERERLDAVCVVVPERAQAEIVREALAARRHVFVEKPLGLSAAEAEEIAALAARSDGKVMVGFMKRFAPAYVELKRAAADEETFGGRMSLMGMFAIGSRQGWGDEWFIKTGGIHFVDLVRHLFGEVHDVRGFANSRGDQVDEMFTMRFSGGQIGSLFFAGLPAWARHYEELTVTGVSGFARAENLTRVISHLDRPLPSDRPRWQGLDEEDLVLTPASTSASGGSRDLYLNGYVGEVEHFLSCVREDREPLCSARDNVKTMALCEQMLRSIGT